MTREQVQELRELKSQETKLHIVINRMIKKNLSSKRREELSRIRDELISNMRPLRDLMLSEIDPFKKDDWLMYWAVRFYFIGMTAFEVADMFGYKNNTIIIQKIRKAESMVTSDEQ